MSSRQFAYLDDLNPAQREAVLALEGPVMVLAGAGSGKTRVLTYRVAHLLASGVPASRILALTFTNKAASEMKHRVRTLVGAESERVWMGTFHSLFARILRKESHRLGFDSHFSIYDTLDSHNLIKTIQERLGIPTQQYHPHAIRSRISAAKNRCLTPQEYAALASDVFEEKTARIFAEYQKRLLQANAMDFDDLLLKPLELFRNEKRVLANYHERFQYILVDEYQDTNRTQFLLLKLLAGEHGNICVVGDDAQSIYAFRGADIRNILDFEKEFEGCRIFRLEQNYRSTKTVLAAADQLIKNNSEQLHKELWTENPEGEPIGLLVCSDDKDEGRQIVERIRHEIMKKKLGLNDVAILYRTNAQSRSLEDALRMAGMPYTIVGGIEFYNRKEIKDVVAYLRLICNPRDDESFRRILNYPPRGIGDRTESRLREFAERHWLSLWASLDRIGELSTISDAAGRRLREFQRFVQKYMRLKSEMSASEVARALVDELGILQEWKNEGTLEALGRWENVQELLSAVTEYSVDHPGATLEEFLEEVSLVTDIDTWDENRNAVTLMTAHSAKGLEFSIVFMAGMEEGLFPFYNSTLDRLHLEEERRLCYVAMTRAREKLYMSYARLRYRFGDATYPSPSRFLEEIHPSLFDGDRLHRATPARQTMLRAGNGKRARRRGAPHSEVDEFVQSHPDYENESQEGGNVRAGMLVRHEVFGRGRVIGVEGRGESARAVVDFETVGRKHLMLVYARLQPVKS